ncbi:MAG: cell wall metabolism sensor histidine kinase WalK [Oscillospiraceae bacterium]|nr:cell wall metabolism sensor histidine kinase WalK [Oscillospiraceae bacterium]
MLRSLRVRLVTVMMLLIILMLAVMGVFLAGGVATHHINAFAGQMEEAFTLRLDFIGALRAGAGADDPPAALKEILTGHSALLGIDNLQRNFYILDAKTGAFLAGSDEQKGAALELTPSILTVLADNTKPAPIDARIGAGYMDFAAPIEGARGVYIVYIKDTNESSQELISQLLSVVFETLVVGVAMAIVLSLVLSKAITTPLERLTRGARRMASGTFAEGAAVAVAVESDDEIGVLTSTFNDMARELQRTLEEVGSERDKLGTLFLHMTDGVASFTRDGAPLQANPSAERMLGCHFSDMPRYDEVLGDVAPLAEVLALCEEPRFLLKECERGGRRLLISLAPFGREGIDGIMAVLHDVTEQHRLDEVRREFVLNVSHELRTPLTNIRSYAETLLDAKDLPPETASSFTQVILREAERMNNIVRDLLSLSRFDYGKLDWHVASFPLDEMLQSIHAAMLLEAERMRHELTLSCQSPLFLTGDRARLEQVVVNVLTNALKYTPAGGRVEVSASQTGDTARIVVRDNGIGIPKEDLPHIFERFYRVDKARTRHSGGTGLGLSIAREIVEAHHGVIDISSVSGEGTTVTISLPVEGEGAS